VATVGAPWFIPASAMGTAGNTPPSERITMASIGCGGMGTNNLRAFLAQPDVQVLAVCDVVTASDEYGHWYKQGWNGAWFGREPARKIVDNDYAQKAPSGSYKGCDAYVDFREIIARDDIDAVCITTPDHWHAIPAVMAAAAGKDIYCEKPLCLTVAEGRAMVEAARRYNRVFQTGTQRRSSEPYRFICELIRVLAASLHEKVLLRGYRQRLSASLMGSAARGRGRPGLTDRTDFWRTADECQSPRECPNSPFPRTTPARSMAQPAVRS